MPPYAPEPEVAGGRRQGALLAIFLVLALVALYLPQTAQQQVAFAVRASVLRPFIATQERLAASRIRALDVDRLQAELDSLSEILATQSAVSDENRTLRNLLALSERLRPNFQAASVLRPGTSGSESMFFIDRGSDDGVFEGAPVIDRHGLVGVIREVAAHTAVGMDWTHPDFRASAMLADGTAYGVVENRRGAFREQDRFVINGTAYYESVPDGVAVLTSGLGVLPRGIPIGSIDGIAEVEGRWRKSYWLRPMAHPASVTHVLVGTGETTTDVSVAWPTDSIVARDQAILREHAQRDSLAALRDTVQLLRARVEALTEQPRGQRR